MNTTQIDEWTDEELASWLAFSQLSGTGLGASKVLMLYNHLGSLSFAWKANRDQLRFVPGLSEQIIDQFLAKRPEIKPDALLQSVKGKGITAIPYDHVEYPAHLREIHDPPCVLYMKGLLTVDDLHHAVGVVGTRRPTSYGQRIAKETASGLAKAGVTVISGMAVGIDSFAHRAALDGGGKTVAVLGCGVDVCYPSSNRPLYEMLISGNYGAVVSEFFPGTKPEKWHFPQRNRIISGLSQALVVVEAGQDSGALITARLAFEQSREVFAVPGRVDSPMSDGTNSLIAKNTAHLMKSYEDVLTEMNWVAAGSAREVPVVVELYGREKELYDLLSNEPVHFDVLVKLTGMPVGELSATLTMLELAGVVTKYPGDWYARQ